MITVFSPSRCGKSGCHLFDFSSDNVNPVRIEDFFVRLNASSLRPPNQVNTDTHIKLVV